MRFIVIIALSIMVAGCSDSGNSSSVPALPSRSVELSEPIPRGYRCSAFERNPRLESGQVPQFADLKDGIHIFESLAVIKDALAEPLVGSIEDSESWSEKLFDQHPGRRIAVALVSYSDQESMGLHSVGNLGELTASATFIGLGETTNFDHQYLLAVFTLDPN